MSTHDFAVTVALRVAIITTSITGTLAILFSMWVAVTQSPTSPFYNGPSHPNLVAGLAMLFGSVMWTSIILSFLLYMSWRVRSGSSGATAYVGFSPPGGPSSGVNSRRQASTSGAYD